MGDDAEFHSVDIGGDTGAGSATGQGSVRAQNIAGRDQARTQNINGLLVRLHDEAQSAGERLLATLVFALHEEMREEIQNLRAELYSNGLVSDVRALQQQIAALAAHPAQCPFLEAEARGVEMAARRRELARLAVQVAIAAGLVILALAAAVIAARLALAGG